MEFYLNYYLLMNSYLIFYLANYFSSIVFTNKVELATFYLEYK